MLEVQNLINQILENYFKYLTQWSLLSTTPDIMIFDRLFSDQVQLKASDQYPIFLQITNCGLFFSFACVSFHLDCTEGTLFQSG